MSRAFVKEDDADPGVVSLPDRPVSPHRNLVTHRGLRLIESKVARYEHDLARATAAADREALGRAARELRYWTARLASARVAEPDPETDHVVFGTAVTVLREDETEATFRIVGEDEADPSTGRIAWTAPVAQALLGSRPGDLGSCGQARSRSCPSVGPPKRSSSFGRQTVAQKPGSLLLPIHRPTALRGSRSHYISIRTSKMTGHLFPVRKKVPRSLE